jgi:hypothetical protein
MFGQKSEKQKQIFMCEEQRPVYPQIVLYHALMLAE